MDGHHATQQAIGIDAAHRVDRVIEHDRGSVRAGLVERDSTGPAIAGRCPAVHLGGPLLQRPVTPRAADQEQALAVGDNPWTFPPGISGKIPIGPLSRGRIQRRDQSVASAEVASHRNAVPAG